MIEQSTLQFPKDKTMLNESFLRMFGAWTEFVLKRMFDIDNIPECTVRGRQTDIERLVSVLASEKRYIDSYLKYKLNDPRIINDKFKLEQSVRDFELNTGIKWPLK